MLFQKNDTVLFIGDSISDYERKRPVGKGLRNAWGTSYVACAGALLATGEDHIGRTTGAQRAVTLLAQHPAQGVGDIALAAAVWPDDGRDAAVKDKFRL